MWLNATFSIQLSLLANFVPVGVTNAYYNKWLIFRPSGTLSNIESIVDRYNIFEGSKSCKIKVENLVLNFAILILISIVEQLRIVGAAFKENLFSKVKVLFQGRSFSR